MESKQPKEVLEAFAAALDEFASGSPEAAKLAARFAEVGIGVPISVSLEDTPRELLETILSGTQGPLTARVIAPTKKPESEK